MNPYTKFRLKKLAARLGMRFRTSAPRRRTMQDFCHYLRDRGFVPGAIIDAGVADGTFDIYTVFPKARYLLVEPLQEFKPAIDSICGMYNATVEYAAAGSAEGEQNLFFIGESIAEKHGASFLGHSAGNVISKPEGFRSVPVSRLDALAEKHCLKGPILLKADTQGTEHSVFEGARGIWPAIEVAILETSLFRFEKDQPTIDETISFMSERGFVPYEFFGGMNRPLDRALAQIDVAFVKRDGMFRTDHRFSSDGDIQLVGGRSAKFIRQILGI